MALLVRHVGEYAPHDLAKRAGVLKGDLLIAFDARTDLWTESDVIAYALWEKARGDRVPLKLIRDGKTISLTLEISR
jgi:S1-C subfamily serine protease